MLRLALLGLAALAPVLAGCAVALPRPRTTLAEAEVFDACERPITLDELARRAAESDAVILGEMHGHPLGLAVSAALYDKILAEKGRATLSLEFLERDKQGVVDDYLAGRSDEATFFARSGLRRTEPEPGHFAMIEAARRAGAPVVASNAPRALAKKARVEGYAALSSLPEAERALFVVPDPMPQGRYAEAFAKLMGGESHGGEPKASSDKVASFFRAQALWDATMADSIARAIADRPARGAERGPVFHVVGRFHVEHDGGLVQLLRRAAPEARVLSIVLVESRDEVSPGIGDAFVVVGPAPAAER
jgi:uncharacterized iron-regulated protein